MIIHVCVCVSVCVLTWPAGLCTVQRPFDKLPKIEKSLNAAKARKMQENVVELEVE